MPQMCTNGVECLSKITEISTLKKQVEGHCDRIAKQSEPLSKEEGTVVKVRVVSDRQIEVSMTRTDVECMLFEFKYGHKSKGMPPMAFDEFTGIRVTVKIDDSEREFET